MYAAAHEWRSEDNYELVLPFHHVGALIKPSFSDLAESILPH